MEKEWHDNDVEDLRKNILRQDDVQLVYTLYLILIKYNYTLLYVIFVGSCMRPFILPLKGFCASMFTSSHDPCYFISNERNRIMDPTVNKDTRCSWFFLFLIYKCSETFWSSGIELQDKNLRNILEEGRLAGKLKLVTISVKNMYGSCPTYLEISQKYH